MNEYRFSVPCDLALSIRGESEAEARAKLVGAVLFAIDGIDVDPSGDHDTRLYTYEGDCEKAEVMDTTEEVE